MPQMNTEGITGSMEPLLQEAEQRGLWLKPKFLELCFSPAELRHALDQGRFAHGWGPLNWELIDPQAPINAALLQVQEAHESLKSIRERVSKWAAQRAQTLNPKP